MENIKQRMHELYPSVSEIITIDNEDLFTILINRLNCFDENVISIVLHELQKSNHCKNSTLWSLLRNFNNSFLEGNEEMLHDIIESAKILGCVKDITLEKDNIYKLTTPNNHNILFTQSYDTLTAATKVTNQCHGVTQSYLLRRGDTYDCIAAVSKMKTHFNHHMYHSYIIQENRILDMAMNLVMSKNDYYRLFRPQSIATFSKQEFSIMSAQLQREDEDFVSANIDELLKCAMAKQMKKEKRYQL